MKLLGWLIHLLVMGVGRTVRLRGDDPAGVLDSPPPQPVIFAFWHNRIFLAPALFRRYWAPHGRDRVAVLVSASRDGEKLVQVLQPFRLRCVRGSSSRRGRQALVELARLVRDGFDIGITPDGPRGPRYRVQEGVISLAQVTGAPIVPVGWTAAWQWISRRSWDRFIVPLPFSPIQWRVGRPLVVERDTDAAGRERKRLELERILNELNGHSP